MARHGGSGVNVAPPVGDAQAREPNARARALFSQLPARYDMLAELLSFGQNGRWRAAMVEQISVPPGGVILDVATGTAGVAIRLARRTDAHVVGIDLTETMVRTGIQRVHRSGLSQRIQMVVGRGEELPFADAAFDALTFTYLLRYVADPAATLVELARVLKPGATVASLDFLVPRQRGWRALWWLYTRTLLPAAGGAFGRAWFDVGRFLGPSISGFYRRHPVASLVAAWQDAGFTGIGVATMSAGGGLVMWGRKRDD